MSKLDELIAELCPRGVEFCKLLDVCDDIIVPMRDRPKDLSGPIPWCRIEDKEGQYFNGSLSGLGVSEETIKKMNLKVFPVGTVICSCSASIGAYAINTQPLITNQTFIGLVCGKELFNKYLLYYMETQTAYLLSQASTGTIPYISRKKFEEMPVPVPPLEVQREIVRILDNFTELTEELTEKLTEELTARKKQYEYYRDVLLNKNILECKKQKLSEIAEVYDGTHQTPDYKTEGVPFISVENIANIYGSQKYISCEDYAKYKIKPKIGDLFMTRIGSIGKCAVFDKEADLAYYVSLALIRPKQDVVTARYLKHYIESIAGTKELARRTLHNAVPIKINKDDIGKILVSYPSLEVQNKICDTLDNFEKICNDLNIGLPAEIEARQKQYEFYRDQLLTFAENGETILTDRQTDRQTELSLIKLLQYVFGYASVRLGIFATVTRGGNFQKKDFVENGKPCIHYGQMYTHFGVHADKTLTFVDQNVFDKSKIAKQGDIVMAVTSENVEDVCSCTAWLGGDDIAVSGHTAIISHNQNAKYLSYYFHSADFFSKKKKLAHGTKVIEITPSALEDVVINLPCMNEQERIVSILDRFDALCNDLSSGLPAEIEARQKQYEYYRDMLLSFKEAE